MLATYIEHLLLSRPYMLIPVRLRTFDFSWIFVTLKSTKNNRSLASKHCLMQPGTWGSALRMLFCIAGRITLHEDAVHFTHTIAALNKLRRHTYSTYRFHCRFPRLVGDHHAGPREQHERPAEVGWQRIEVLHLRQTTLRAHLRFHMLVHIPVRTVRHQRVPWRYSCHSSFY